MHILPKSLGRDKLSTMSFGASLLPSSAAATISQILAQKRKQALANETTSDYGINNPDNLAPEPPPPVTGMPRDLPTIAAQSAESMPQSTPDTSSFEGPPPAPPLQHAVDPKITRSGLVMPQRSDFDNISRRRSMVEALATGLQATNGNLGGGLAGLVTGLLSKGIGRNLAYNNALSHFQQQKAIENTLDRQDPAFQESIQTRAAYDRAPLDIYKQGKAQEEMLNRQTQVEELRQRGQQKKAQLVADAAMQRTRENNKARGIVVDKNNEARATLDHRKIAARFSGQQWYEALSDPDKAEAVSDEAQRLQDQQDQYKQAQTQQAESRAGQADATTDKTRDQMANPGKYSSRTGNVSFQDRDAISTINKEIQSLNQQKNSVQKNRGLLSDERKEQLAALDQQIKDASDRKAAKMQQIGSGGGGGQLTPQQKADYDARKAKHPGLTVQQYLDIMQKLNQ